MVHIEGCHLVGSVPLSDTESVLRQCSAGLPARLKRIPDGETGVSRNAFTYCQAFVFQSSPAMLYRFVQNAPVVGGEFTEHEVDEGVEKLKKAGPINTGYDAFAIESYQVFRRMREEGVVSKGTRFQVSLPTTPNVLTPFVEFAFQPKVEPIYEEALFRAMRSIQDTIPHEDLAIQIDLAIDTAFWERIEMMKPWFGEGDHEKVKEYIVNYIVRMVGQVDQDVEVGVHNCYGDMEHRHWAEPTSLTVIVERGLRVIGKSPHLINFFHCPVPKSAVDNLDAYYAPLEDLVPKLKEHGTELYLGVIHYDDMATTKKMIEAAGKVLGNFPFGIASECGWGRTPPEQITEIMKMSTELSQPVS